MKTILFLLLLAMVLSACAPAAAPAPAATLIPPPAQTANLPAVTPPPASTAPGYSQAAADLDKTLQDLTTANQFSGSILVAQGGQVILSKGYGFANREQKITNTAQTEFRITYITAQFTALAILMLQEQAKLKVQDKICTYLAACPEAWKPITIHQLLTLTSGIPDNSGDFIAQGPTSSASLEKMIAEVQKLPLDYQPGEKFSINNMDYILLGKIIESASGGSYEAFLQKNIFEPLQMSHTGYDPNRKGLAIGYADRSSVADPINPWVLFSAAGLYSTVEDLYRFDQALATPGKLVPQKVLDTIFNSYVQSDREGYGFGYGWYVGSDKPHINKIFGNLNGFNTTFRRYLDDKLTILILLNQEDNDIVALANSIPGKVLAATSAATGSNPSTPASAAAPWSLVAVGDSIPFNSPDDCNGCTGFVDRYAAAISKATGHPVKVQNLSQHNGLQTDGLLQELKTDTMRRDALAHADIIVVSIGHNDTAWNRDDDPCDGPSGNDIDWQKFNPTCAAAAAEVFRPMLESVFAQIAALRAGKPTIFRTINVYNDWLGDPGNNNPNDLTPVAKTAVKDFLDAWDAMVSKAAQANGFSCGDIYHAFNGPDGTRPAGDLLGKDYTHPSDKGNEVIAGVLAGLGVAPLAPK